MLPFARVTIIGLGLIGSSLARAIRADMPTVRVTGHDADAVDAGLRNLIPGILGGHRRGEGRGGRPGQNGHDGEQNFHTHYFLHG